MSHFGNPTDQPDPGQTEAFEPPAAFDPVYAGADEPVVTEEAVEPPSHKVGARLAEFRERVVRALYNLDRGPVGHPQTEDGRELEQPRPATGGELLTEVPPRSHDARLPVGPLGYSRGAVEERIAALEQEIVTLEQELQDARESNAPVSITEEIERLGEQTASILVVAHGQANETTRRAQEEAEQCLADAATNANLLTDEARRRLAEIDNDTDAVWRERARLLDDARDVGLSLIALAEEAAERFPPEVKTNEVPQAAD